jgi:hypothetical protein
MSFHIVIYMKKSKIILIILLLIVLFLGLYFLKRKPEVPFKDIELPNTSNFINNRTENKYLDTVILLAADRLGIDAAIISVFPMNEQVRINFERENNISLTAFIIGSDYRYAIYTQDLDRMESITVLSHELIHLKQYQTKRLVIIGNGVVEWEGQKIDVNLIPYNDRPWEREAFREETKISKDLKKILY